MKKKFTHVNNKLAGLLVGLALGFGIIPLVIASLLISKNIPLMILEMMDSFWKELETKDK